MYRETNYNIVFIQITQLLWKYKTINISGFDVIVTKVKMFNYIEVYNERSMAWRMLNNLTQLDIFTLTMRSDSDTPIREPIVFL